MRRELTSLALVKAVYTHSGYKRDYVENFVPFVANLIRKRRIASITPSELTGFLKDFENEYGLIIPYHPMLAILERCRKRGLLRRESHQFIVISETTQEYDFCHLVAKKECEINELLQDVIKYAKTTFSLVVSMDEMQNTILSYFQAHDMDMIFAAQSDSIIPEIEGRSDLTYIFADYVSHIRNTNVSMFERIIEIAVGHVLANTILYVNKNCKYEGKLKGLCFYVDTRFIFRFLGYEGELFRTAYIDLLQTLIDQEAEIYVFDHTLEEVSSILQGAMAWVDTPGYDPRRASSVLSFYRNTGKNKADIQHDLAVIDDRIRQFGIRVVPGPIFSQSEDRQIDERKLQEIIVERYALRHKGFDIEEKKYTIEKDIKSISSIYHLRVMRRPCTMKQAKQFFLTSNSGLAYAAHCYEMDELKGEKHIPACITDVFIGTYAWMQSPVKYVDMNQKRFLAECMSLLDPTPTFLKKLIDEAEKLIDLGKLSDDEFIVLRSSIYIQRSLFRETLGNPDSINADSMEEAINRIRAEATAPLIENIRQKDADVMHLQGEKATSEREKQEYRSTLENIAVADAHRYTNVLCYVMWGGFALTLVPRFFTYPGWIGIILGILSACFAIAGIGFGLDMKHVRQGLFVHRLAIVRRKYGLSADNVQEDGTQVDRDSPSLS